MFRSDASLRDADQSRGNGAKPPPSAHHAIQHFELARLQPAPSVQLIARDPFVADVAIRLDQVRGELKAFSREIETVKVLISDLRADTDRNYRFSSFQEREQRARIEKLDDLVKRHADLKARVDGLEGKTRGDYHLYGDFASVSKKLTELEAIQRTFKSAQLKLQVSAGLFCGSVLMWLLAVLA